MGGDTDEPGATTGDRRVAKRKPGTPRPDERPWRDGGVAESADKRLGEADTLAVEQTVALGQVPHSATEGIRGGEFPHGLSPRGQDAAAKEASKDGTDY